MPGASVLPPSAGPSSSAPARTSNLGPADRRPALQHPLHPARAELGPGHRCEDLERLPSLLSQHRDKERQTPCPDPSSPGVPGRGRRHLESVRVRTDPAPTGLQPGLRVPGPTRVSPRARWRSLKVVVPLCVSERLGASTSDAKVCEERGCVVAGDPSNPPQPAVTSAPPPSTRPDRGPEGAESQLVA